MDPATLARSVSGWVPFGAHAVLLTCTPEEVSQLTVAARLVAKELGALDVVPAAQTVLIDGVVDPALAARRVWAAVADANVPQVQTRVTLPTTYDGPDLRWVGEQWRMSPEAVARRHAEIEFEVTFCGFSPGFAYCRGLPAELAVSRLDEPRTRVPAGSVALAGEWTGVYPQATPGGWRLLGHTDAILWDPRRDEPALLSPGTIVRFVES